MFRGFTVLLFVERGWVSGRFLLKINLKQILLKVIKHSNSILKTFLLMKLIFNCIKLHERPFKTKIRFPCAVKLIYEVYKL